MLEQGRRFGSFQVAAFLILSRCSQGITLTLSPRPRRGCCPPLEGDYKSILVVLFMVFAQFLVRQWLRVFRQFPWTCGRLFHTFYVLVNSFPEVDCVLLSIVVFGAVFTADSSVASAHGYLGAISTSSLYLAVTFAVIGLSFPSWCNDSVYGPDSCMRRNPWSFCRCSSWTQLRRARRPSTTGVLVQTMQKSVTMLLLVRCVQERGVQTAQDTEEFPQGAVIGQGVAYPLLCSSDPQIIEEIGKAIQLVRTTVEQIVASCLRS